MFHRELVKMLALTPHCILVFVLKAGPEEIKWEELLDASSAHKLMYSLQIVEYLSRPPRLRKASIVSQHSISTYITIQFEF